MQPHATESRLEPILVVEDEEVLQMLLSADLADLGFNAEVAGLAEEARALMQSLAGDVVGALIDVGLPDGRGDDLARYLRATYPGLRTILATGHDERSIQAHFPIADDVSVLTKPFTADQLRLALMRVGIL